VRGSELTRGRIFGVAFDDGEDFFAALAEFCRTHGIRQGFVPVFIAGFATVEVVGTCVKVDDPRAPVTTGVHLTNVEALGGGTIAYDEANEAIRPHIHVSVGLKQHSATAHTSHLLSAEVQILTEMMIIEITEPPMWRRVDPDLYGVPQLRFGTG